MYANEERRTSRAPRGLSTLFAIIIGASLLIVGFAAGAVTTWAMGPDFRGIVALLPGEILRDQREQDASMQVFWDAWSILEDEYIDPTALNEEDMVRSATAGMVASVGDPHTTFLEPVQATIMDQDMTGSFEGIGATVDQIDGRIVIVRPLPNSPAESAGLLSQDVVLAVDGHSLEGMSLLEVITLIRGERGSVVTLTIAREGVPEPFDMPVTRDTVDLPVVDSRMLDGNVGYIRLTQFNSVARARVREALDTLMGQDPVGLVLDLRGNPGGYLQSAVDVSSEFLPIRSLVLLEQQRDRPVKEYRVVRRGRATEIPLVVLVDGGSASAAEIVAGALQENDRAILIGEKTYGKGSVQRTHTLADGSSLHVTIAKWNLPSGTNLDQNGLVPDIESPISPEDAAANRDTQLERAATFLLNGE
ncbi:MAG: S41 family peptidase [Anaerolineae bacterium]